MIDIDALLKILLVFVVGLISPGPDFMAVSTMSLKRGRIDGIKTAAGIATVIILYTFVCLTGLAVLFAHYLWAVAAIKIGGGVYLLYLGVQLWRASLKPDAKAAQAPPVEIQKNSYLMGVLVCLTNPKAIAFFASIFALALTPDTTFATKATIQMVVPMTTFLWFSFVAFSLSKPYVRNRYQRWQKAIDRITGSVIGLFGLKLILSAKD